ncbi:MAG: Type 4 fimbrial biosis protein PilO [Pseudomonadota bacterium]|jgi:type IV pilus assembly protein PilO
MANAKNWLDELKNFDVNDLSDIDTIGIWPGPVKAVIVLIIFVGCMSAGWFLHVQNLQQDLQREIAAESTVRTELEQKAFLAANLEEYQAQTVEMEESFAELLLQLPSQTEVPGLVDDITNVGLGSGLEFSNIQLADEVAQEFYIELPINVDVQGNYHDFGTFVSGVASLDRIVTLHDFSISSSANTFLNMSIVAKTYRYKAEDEQL